jgi:hypothetical protein
LSTHGTAATNTHIVPAPGDYDDGVLGENLPQYSFVPHKHHMPGGTRTRAAVVKSQRLTASATARTFHLLKGM